MAQHFLIFEGGGQIVAEVLLVNLGDANRDVEFARVLLEELAHGLDGLQEMVVVHELFGPLIFRVAETFAVVAQDQFVEPLRHEVRDIIRDQQAQAHDHEETCPSVSEHLRQIRRGGGGSGVVRHRWVGGGSGVGRIEGVRAGRRVGEGEGQIGRDGRAVGFRIRRLGLSLHSCLFHPHVRAIGVPGEPKGRRDQHHIQDDLDRAVHSNNRNDTT